MQYSSDEISVDSDYQKNDSRSLKYLPHWPAVNIEFQDLVYTVPDISGEYREEKHFDYVKLMNNHEIN